MSAPATLAGQVGANGIVYLLHFDARLRAVPGRAAAATREALHRPRPGATRVPWPGAWRQHGDQRAARGCMLARPGGGHHLAARRARGQAAATASGSSSGRAAPRDPLPAVRRRACGPATLPRNANGSVSRSLTTDEQLAAPA